MELIWLAGAVLPVLLAGVVELVSRVLLVRLVALAEPLALVEQIELVELAVPVWLVALVGTRLAGLLAVTRLAG